MENISEIEVLKPQGLTKSYQNVNKMDLPKYWEKDYINGCINKISNPKQKMFVIFLWRSGIRITEAVSLRKCDIDFNNYTMTVRWLKSRKYNYRVVPLHPHMRDLLQVFSSGLKHEDRLFAFTRQRGWQITRKHMKGHPHQFRHSFAVNWLRCGGELIVLHKILGHSKIQTTLEYLKIVPLDQGKELLKITF